MARDVLTITVGGAERDGGAVQLGDFNRFVADLQSCLKRVDDRVVRSSGVRHLIVSLGVGSASVGIEAVSPPKEPDAGGRLYGAFEETVRGLEGDGEIDRRLTSDDLRAFRKLAAPVMKDRAVQIGGTRLTTQFVATIDRRLSAVRRAIGSVKGRVEKLNVHGRREFTLFTAIGGRPVVCSFSADLFDQVRGAVRASVTVSGLCVYGGPAPFPERVHVRRLEVHPPDSELPLLGALRGVMAGHTNSLSAEELVGAVRNDG